MLKIIYASFLICMLFIDNGESFSLAKSVFLPKDPSINPFADNFIHQIVSMDSFSLGLIRQLDDSEMLDELTYGNSTAFKWISRSSTIDEFYDGFGDDQFDDQLQYQTDVDAEWINLMTAGPTVINHVGSLLVLASKRDFAFTRRGNYTFQHIQNPSSFKATMAQVSRAIYMALLDAHIAMDKIQLRVQQIPENLRSALKLIIAGSPFLIQLTLPKTMEKVTQIGSESATIAAATFDKFSSVQELISEIILANVNTESSQSEIVDRIEKEIEEHKEERDRIQAATNSIQAEYDRSRQDLEKARQEYIAALNAIPAGRFFRRIFRAIIKVVVQIVIAPIKAIVCIFGRCGPSAAALAAQTARENAIRRANELKQVLEQAERRHEQLTTQQTASQQQLNQLITKLANMDLNRLSEKEILDILIEAIVQMSEIKESWGRLVQFFSRISVESDSMHKIIVNEFIAAIKEAQTSNILLDPLDRELFAEMLAFTCQEIERSAHLLYIMSKTYYDVSSEYMINQIASMNMLLLFDTDAERSAYFNQISTMSRDTSAKIIELGEQRQNEYRAQNQARIQQYERFLQSIPEDELEMIFGESF